MSVDLEGVDTLDSVDAQTVRDLLTRVEQLEETVEDQQETIDELEGTVNEANAIANAARNQVKKARDYLIGDEVWEGIDTTHDAHTRLEQAVEELDGLNATVARHQDVIEERGAPKSGKEEHWWKVVEKAHNLRNHPDHGLPDNWVKLHKKQIAGAIEPGEKRASQLIDEWAGEKSNGVQKIPYKRYTTSRKTESSSIQKKALKIDLDVWGLDDE